MEQHTQSYTWHCVSTLLQKDTCYFSRRSVKWSIISSDNYRPLVSLLYYFYYQVGHLADRHYSNKRCISNSKNSDAMPGRWNIFRISLLKAIFFLEIGHNLKLRTNKLNADFFFCVCDKSLQKVNSYAYGWQFNWISISIAFC